MRTACIVLVAVAVTSAAWWLYDRQTTPAPPVEAPAGFWQEKLLAGGNADAGEALFFSSTGPRCGECHVAKGRGGNLGPNLTLAGRSSLEQLVEQVLDPNAVLTHRYESMTLVTHNGLGYSGRIVPSADPQKITLRQDDGQVTTVARADAAEIKLFSSMPDNYASGLTLQQLRDLIAFLQSQKIDPAAFLRGETSAAPAKP